MTTQVDRLRRSPSNFRALTGLTPAAFDGLLAGVEPLHAAAEAKRLGRPGRQRRPGAGRKRVLTLADRLLMLLVYYRTHVTHRFLGFLFGIDDSAVGRNINPLQPLLAGLFRIPERRVDLGEDEVRELFFDATEQPCNRPGRGQAAYYSGKKKRHTIKHQVVVARKRKPPGRRPAGSRPHPRRLRIAAVSPAHGGRTHDKRVYDLARTTTAPPGAPRTGDSGYQGAPGVRVPHEKPKGRELAPRKKAGNRLLSRLRVAAEHGIGKLKIWRIASDKYRGPRRRHTMIAKNVAGLHNLMFA